MFGPIANVIFDLDGTLVDSMPSVIKGLRESITVASGKTVPIDELVASFGPAPYDILKKWLPDEASVALAMRHWLEFERSRGPESYVPFKGVAETLAALKGWRLTLGIFTGRDRASALHILEHHRWLGVYFTATSIICGDDGYAAKPKPDSLLRLMEKMGLRPADTLMVGDHPYDLIAGKAAGTKTAAALWDLPRGPRTHRARFKEAWQKWDQVPCDLRLESPLSLKEWFESPADPH